MENLLKPGEVAEILGVTERMLGNWRRHGVKLKYYKINERTIRYSPSDVEAFIERNRTNV